MMYYINYDTDKKYTFMKMNIGLLGIKCQPDSIVFNERIGI